MSGEQLAESAPPLTDPLVEFLTAWFAENVTHYGFMHSTDEDFAESLAAAMRERMPEPDNHHNAALCPYCNPAQQAAR